MTTTQIQLHDIRPEEVGIAHNSTASPTTHFMWFGDVALFGAGATRIEQTRNLRDALHRATCLLTERLALLYSIEGVDEADALERIEVDG